MEITNEYLEEHKESINENILTLQMMSGAFNLMEEEELEVYRESLLNESLDKFIAFSHIHDSIEMNEGMVRHVNSKGERGIRKSRSERKNLAYKTTSLSKAKRRETALKASKTRMSNPSVVKQASRKRKKAGRKRASLGMDTL